MILKYSSVAASGSGGRKVKCVLNVCKCLAI